MLPCFFQGLVCFLEASIAKSSQMRALKKKAAERGEREAGGQGERVRGRGTGGAAGGAYVPCGAGLNHVVNKPAAGGREGVGERVLVLLHTLLEYLRRAKRHVVEGQNELTCQQIRRQPLSLSSARKKETTRTSGSFSRR